MPLLLVLLAHRAREATVVLTWVSVDAELWREAHTRPHDLEQPLRTLNPIRLRHLGREIQSHVDGQVAEVVNHGVYVRHVASVLPVTNPAHGGGRSRRLVDAEHVHHSADEMNEQISSDSCSVFLPAAPPRKDERVERPLRHHIALPCIPVEIDRRKIERRWILPRSTRIVAAHRPLYQHQIAE